MVTNKYVIAILATVFYPLILWAYLGVEVILWLKFKEWDWRHFPKLCDFYGD